MADNQSTQIEKMLGALGTLERATEFKTFLLLANLAISLNISLTLSHQTNLVGFSWQYVRDHLPVGQALVFLAGFALYMSCFVWAFRFIADSLFIFLKKELTDFIYKGSPQSNQRSQIRPNNMVRPHELLNAARYVDGEDYLLKYNDYIKEKSQENSSVLRTATLSFGLLLLIMVEAVLPDKTSLSGGFVNFLNSIFNGLGNSIGISVILILIFGWLFRFIAEDSKSEWIVCPKLYLELEQENKNHRRESEMYRA